MTSLGLNALTLCLAVLVAGCVAAETAAVEPSTAEDQSSVAPDSGGADIVADDEGLVPQTMVAQVQVLSDEIRSLRDQVEVLESELTETKQRQVDLYNDLDARLRQLERTATAGPSVSSDTEVTEITDADSDGQQPVPPPADESTEGEDAVTETPVNEPVETEFVDPEIVRQVYDTAFRTLRQGKYDEAIVEFNALVQQYPASDLVDDALYWIAEANYVTKKYDLALMGFEQVIRDYPDNRRAAEAMLKMGYIYYDQADFEQARNYLQEVMTRYPASRSAFSASRRLNRLNRDEGSQ